MAKRSVRASAQARSTSRSAASAVQAESEIPPCKVAECGRAMILLALVVAVVAVAGCVGQAPAALPEANGLVIKNLFIDPPADQIQSGEMITVTADIENVGSATARNVVAEIIGASWITPAVAAQFPPNALVLANFVTVDDEGDGFVGTTLTPPDPRYGLPGQLKTLQFRLPAPLLAEGQKANFELKIRIKYDYETSAIAQVKGYSRERYNSLYQQGKLSPPTTAAIPVQVSQNVPITIEVLGPDKFIAGPSLYDEYTYQFTFRNVGTNLPITRSLATGREEDGLILGTIWVQGPGVFFRRCLGVAPEMLYSNVPSGLNSFFTTLQVQYKDRFSAWYEGTSWGEAWGLAGRIGEAFVGIQRVPSAPTVQWPAYVLFPNALSWEVLGFLMDPIKLRKGESVTKSCTIGIINDPLNPATWGDRPEDTMLINAHLKYRYFVDQPMTLTVTAPIVRAPIG
ncbi:MAG: hypothetical protein QW548_02465 [Candidatus Aenigmatarchaeota archaeon]